MAPYAPILLTLLLWDFKDALHLYCNALFDYFFTKHLEIETEENLYFQNVFEFMSVDCIHLFLLETYQACLLLALSHKG